MSYENVDDLIGDLLYLQEGLKPETEKDYRGQISIKTSNNYYTINTDTKIGKFNDMLKLNDAGYEDYYYLIDIDKITSIELIGFDSKPVSGDWECNCNCKDIDTKEIKRQDL